MDHQVHDRVQLPVAQAKGQGGEQVVDHVEGGNADEQGPESTFLIVGERVFFQHGQTPLAKALRYGTLPLQQRLC